MRVGLIGLGRWGKVVLKNLLSIDGFELIYLCDIDQACLSESDPLFQNIPFVTDYRKILENQDIEAVFVSSNSTSHFEIITAALRNKKHVYVDKPLVSSIQELEQVSAIQKMVKKVVFTNHILLYNPYISTLKAYLKQESSEVLFMDLFRYNIRGNADLNVIWDLAIHDIAVLLYLIDENPSSVNCFTSENKSVIDTAFILLQYPSGKVIKLQCSWRYPYSKREMVVALNDKNIYFNELQNSLNVLNLGSQESSTIPISNNNSFVCLDNPLKNALLTFLSKVENYDELEIKKDLSFYGRITKVIEAINLSACSNGIAVPIN